MASTDIPLHWGKEIGKKHWLSSGRVRISGPSLCFLSTTTEERGKSASLLPVTSESLGFPLSFLLIGAREEAWHFLFSLARVGRFLPKDLSCQTPFSHPLVRESRLGW